MPRRRETRLWRRGARKRPACPDVERRLRATAGGLKVLHAAGAPMATRWRLDLHVDWRRRKVKAGGNGAVWRRTFASPQIWRPLLAASARRQARQWANFRLSPKLAAGAESEIVRRVHRLRLHLSAGSFLADAATVPRISRRRLTGSALACAAAGASLPAIAGPAQSKAPLGRGRAGLGDLPRREGLYGR